MAQPVFDAAGFLKFDLESGSIRSRDDQQMAVVPVSLLSSLQAGDKLDTAARAWGEANGQKLSTLLESSPPTAGLELLANHLGGSLAVVGFGKTRVEIHGDALLLDINGGDADQISEGTLGLIGGFLGGYLTSLAAKGPFEVLHLGKGHEGGNLFWAGNPDAVKKVRGLLKDGKEPLEALNILAREGGPK